MGAAYIGKGITITYYGHSAFHLKGPGVSVVIDPWIDNPVLQTPVKALGPVNLILVTHGHGDHLGNTLEIARETGATVVAIHELAQYLARKGVSHFIGMNKGGTISEAGVKITMTQAVHSSVVEEGGQMIPAGDPVGYVVEFPGGLIVYHAGDTAVFKDMELIRELYHPQVAMLPIGSHYVMNPAEAAVACRMLQPEIVIPMHYGTFPVLTGTPEELQTALTGVPGITIIAMKPGESIE